MKLASFTPPHVLFDDTLGRPRSAYSTAQQDVVSIELTPDGVVVTLDIKGQHERYLFVPGGGAGRIARDDPPPPARQPLPTIPENHDVDTRASRKQRNAAPRRFSPE